MSFVHSVFSSKNASIIRNTKSLFKSLHKSRCISTSIVNCLIKNENSSIHIFDRNTKNLQRERAAQATDVNLYDYLKDEIGYRLADRVFDIKRKFKLAADIGNILTHLFSIVKQKKNRLQ